MFSVGIVLLRNGGCVPPIFLETLPGCARDKNDNIFFPRVWPEIFRPKPNSPLRQWKFTAQKPTKIRHSKESRAKRSPSTGKSATGDK
jgi:hypothetical protein